MTFALERFATFFLKLTPTLCLLVTKLGKMFVNMFFIFVIDQIQLLGRTQLEIISNILKLLFVMLFLSKAHK